MSGFVVMVDFRLKSGVLAEFRRMIDANAHASVRDEPGCRRFDVIEVQGEADRVLLYELYDDEASFHLHCRTEHFATFDALSSSLVSKKIVIQGNLVCEG